MMPVKRFGKYWTRILESRDGAHCYGRAIENDWTGRGIGGNQRQVRAAGLGLADIFKPKEEGPETNI